MNGFWTYNSPISTTDLRSIERILRNANLFCTSFHDEDVYSLALYYSQAEMHGTDACVVLDRNIYSRIVELGQGARATSDHRLAAAVMAFAQCADMAFEPGVAVHEGFAYQDRTEAERDLAIFRAADNIHPSLFADVALGRSDALGADLLIEKAEVPVLPAEQIREYSFIYPLVLKMGLTELEGGTMADRMRRFLDWSHSNWYLSAPATTLAALAFSGSPPRGAFKHLRSRDRSLTVKGLRNCAWDLTYVTRWSELLKRQSHDGCLYILCSQDKALLWVAHHLLANGNSDRIEVEQALRKLMRDAVYEHYVQLITRNDTPGRAINRAGVDAGAHWQSTVSQLEAQLRAYPAQEEDST